MTGKLIGVFSYELRHAGRRTSLRMQRYEKGGKMNGEKYGYSPYHAAY